MLFYTSYLCKSSLSTFCCIPSRVGKKRSIIDDADFCNKEPPRGGSCDVTMAEPTKGICSKKSHGLGKGDKDIVEKEDNVKTTF